MSNYQDNGVCVGRHRQACAVCAGKKAPHQNDAFPFTSLSLIDVLVTLTTGTRKTAALKRNLAKVYAVR